MIGNFKFQIVVKRQFFFKKANFKFTRGFTLLEFLIVIGLLSITIGSILLFLTSVLKGTNQANITSEVKQNGQVVLDTLESQIRNASDASLILTTYIKLLRQNADPLHIRCVNPAGENGRIEIAVSTDQPATNFTSITSQDTVSGVDITYCSFTIIPTSGGVSDPPIVSVSFTVNQGRDAFSRVDFMANVSFQTTISLRGY